MIKTGYWMRQCGRMYICNLTDKRLCAQLLIFQTMGKTEKHAIRKMNRLLKRFDYKLGERNVAPGFFHNFY